MNNHYHHNHNNYQSGDGLRTTMDKKQSSNKRNVQEKRQRRPQLPWKCLLSIALLCLCSYYNSLGCDFVFDDISAVKTNKDLRPETPIGQLFQNDFWGLPMNNEKSHKSYRPLCILTFRLNYWLHELRPYGYHLSNVFLHFIVCILFFRFCQMLMSFQESFIASILFSIHPIHVEAVTSVVGRAETLSAVFFLVSLLAYAQATERPDRTKWATLLASIISITMATFSKEQGITAIAICLLLELDFNQKLLFRLANVKSQYFSKSPLQLTMWMDVAVLWQRRKYQKLLLACPKWIKEMIIRIFILITVAIILLWTRMVVMHWQLPAFTKFDNPAVAESSRMVRQLTHNYVYALNVWLLLYPMNLCCDWTMGSIPLVQTLADCRNIYTAVFYISLLSLLWKSLLLSNRKHCSTVLLVSLSLMIVPFIPASNLFFPVGFVIAERVLYIPSFGYCMLISHGFVTLMSYGQSYENVTCWWKIITPHNKTRRKFLLQSSLILLVAFHSFRIVLRNEDWRTEHSIFLSGIKVNQNNAKLYNNLGHVYESRGQHEEALAYYLQAVQIQPDDIGAYSNVARVYDRLNRFDLAEKYYSIAKNILLQELQQHRQKNVARIAPGHLGLFLNLANIISRNKTRLEEADSLYRQVIKMRSDYVEAYINRGDILLRMNRTLEADHIYRTALNYDNNNADIYYNLGVVAIHSNKLDQAIHYFDKAIQINAEHTQALFNFALVVQDAKRTELFDQAKQHLQKLSRVDENNERIYFNMAMISMSNKNYSEAERYFRQCLRLNRNFSSANFNLALLLSETGRPLDSVPYLERLLNIQPDHIKALTLLGDILINFQKDFDKSADCYHRILKLDPRNIQAKHNLCVVYVEKNMLQEAEKCLEEARVIAPNQDYINRHLKIVKLRLLKMKQQQQYSGSNVKN